MLKEIVSGDIVLSLTGRDQGNLFYVLEVNNNYAFIIDGKIRKTEKPKKKNIKHLCKTDYVLSKDVAERIKTGKPVGKKKLYKAIYQNKIQ